MYHLVTQYHFWFFYSVDTRSITPIKSCTIVGTIQSPLYLGALENDIKTGDYIDIPLNLEKVLMVLGVY